MVLALNLRNLSTRYGYYPIPFFMFNLSTLRRNLFLLTVYKQQIIKKINMLDPMDNELTNKFRGQLRKRQENVDPSESTGENSKVTKALKDTAKFFQFVTAIFAVWGAQYFLLDKMTITPFNFWQSSTILIAFLYITKVVRG